MERTDNRIVRFGEILDMVKSYYQDADLDLIRAAYVYSARVHQGQTRMSGEPYLTHPVAVAAILAQMKLDEASVATGLLHDTVEDTLSTFEDIESYFGTEIATLVDGVTKISKIAFQSKEERQAENFRKMILAMSRDIRVLLVKLADRLHNMRTLTHMPREAQVRISRETMEIYAPLAARLGIYWMRTTLEELAFKYLEPDRYEFILKRLEESVEEREKYVNEVLTVITDKLEKENINTIIKGRNKDIYSIHRKMLSQRLEFEQLHDLTAFRIILDSVSECYTVLGLIHAIWRPVPGRFKDYLAMPKSNGYQSLHTTVIGPEGHRIEIQIRTHEMDLIAEEGIAAHWSYKEGKSVTPEDTRVVNWLRQMMEWQQDLDDPREFLENVRVDLYPDEVYVFTPKGDVKEFPRGSTPLDFAYSIHTEVGQSCIGARVNGKMVSLKYELTTGDTIEIITSTHQKPSKDWLKHVKTGRARTKIRHYLLSQEREKAIEQGRETVERELRKWRIDLNRVEKEGAILKIAQEFNFKTELDLYVAIGHGRQSAKIIVTRLVPLSEREQPKTLALEEKLNTPRRPKGKSGVKVQGLSDMLVHFARCCNPLPGDSILGFITRGRGVTIHKTDCANLPDSDPKRILEASWDDSQPLQRTVKIGLLSDNKPGMLAAVSGVFTSNDSNIIQANVSSIDDTNARGVFLVGVRNVEHLTRIINALKKVKGIREVERLGTI
ncbi:MAG: bifunctional (p)ppGpp synthetase/guanosine-3',5'-bis(diphosphate) 3'-pyrophosphohydrolase [Deltaproteobacteria bacterium]|nr:bifunctional (p)ppGpp synthetase/guanosine-3',5'-bis(diphosphate) 3'-pyrophosphohydrolase [Deltaproteobacteria bacterium]